MRIVGFVVSVCVLVASGWAGDAAARDLYNESRWVDDQGRPYDARALHGRYAVATLAYGACRRVCSASLLLMQRLQAMADEKHVALTFLVFGIDPEQDKPADWAQLRHDRQLERDNWVFLSGDAASVDRVARSLGVRYWRYGEHTMHDFRIVLLSPSGEVVRGIDSFEEELAVLLP